jgi:integrase
MARRRFQRGSLFKVEGSWVGRWREDTIEGGAVKRIKRSAVLGSAKELTRHQAQRLLDEKLAAVNAVSYRPLPACTFREFAARWELLMLPQYKHSCRPTMRGHMKNYLLPFFGDMQLRSIAPEVIQRFVTGLTGTRASQTVRNVFTTLRASWGAAQGWHYAGPEDLFSRIKLPEQDHADRPALPVDKVKAALESAREPFRTFLWIIAETGVRVGEACGLRVQDLDLGRRLLTVRRASWDGKLGTPKKNHKGRQCWLSEQLSQHLAGFLATVKATPEGLLFPSRRGTPLNQKNLLRRKLKPMLAALAVPARRGLGFHSLRHTNSTIMDSEAVPLAVRQKRLGHADAATTLNYYTEPITADEKRLVDKLGLMLSPNAGPARVLAIAGASLDKAGPGGGSAPAPLEDMPDGSILTPVSLWLQSQSL